MHFTIIIWYYLLVITKSIFAIDMITVVVLRALHFSKELLVSTQSKQWRTELLYRYKQAKTSRITVLNIQKLYVYFKLYAYFVYFKLYLYFGHFKLYVLNSNTNPYKNVILYTLTLITNRSVKNPAVPLIPS